MDIKIFAIDSNNERFEISDLFWFEENGIQWFDGEGDFEKFNFEIWVDNNCVFKTY